MKLYRVVTDEGIKSAVEHGDTLYDIGAILESEPPDDSRSFYGWFSSNQQRLLKELKSGPDQEASITPNSYQIPVHGLNQIRDFYAFETHVRNSRALRNQEVPKEWYEVPAYYYSGTSGVIPSGRNLKYPRFSKELDYELEVAAVIGREGRDIPRGEVWNHIFGFLLVSDWSARDQQRKEMAIGLGPSKSKDFATTFGYSITTSDEIKAKLNSDGRIVETVWANINGKEYSRGNLQDMYWTFQDIISWASTDCTLKPGDVIMSGTVGNGCILERSKSGMDWLKPGDTVEFGSDSMGQLKTEIVE